jgi:hypothetical protein
VFLALRWMILEKVSGVGAMRHWLYLVAKALGVGPAVRILEAPGRSSQEPGCVLSHVSWLGRNQCPSVPWVQDPEKFNEN